jgi:hypothetical protein
LWTASVRAAPIPAFGEFTGEECGQNSSGSSSLRIPLPRMPPQVLPVLNAEPGKHFI